MKRNEKKKLTLVIILAVLLAALLFLLAVLMKGNIALPSAPTPSPSPTPAVTPAPTPEPTPKPTPTPTPAPVYDLTSDDSLTVLVDKKHLLPSGYVPENLRVVNVHSAEDKYLRDDAASSLEEMFQAAINEQVYLKLVDGYRSYSYQNDLYHYYISQKGQAYADRIDAYPGASEHQTGLGADIGNWNGKCELNYCFVNYESYPWLTQHAWEYGWIERYPKDKEEITGIEYSPWHYRYVGKDVAKLIHDSGLTFEEYFMQNGGLPAEDSGESQEQTDSQ